MFKNVASQSIGAQMITAADGSAFTGAVTVAVTGDSGAQATGSVGAGACAHEGGGYHSYRPAQAETNYDHVAFTFSGTGAISVTVQVFPKPDIPTAVWAVATRTLTAIDEDSTTLDIDAAVRAAVGMAAADLDTQIGTLATAANLATVAGYLDTEIAAILADTNELQGDWANGGRLDLILDARASQASVDDLPTNAELATALGTADDAVLAAIAALNDFDPTTDQVIVATNNDKTGYALTADIRIKKNTALANFTFLMVDTSDVPATGLSVTAERSLDGAALGAMANSVTEISNGLYKINLAQADTNADICCYRFTATGAKDRVIMFPTQTE